MHLNHYQIETEHLGNFQVPKSMSKDLRWEAQLWGIGLWIIPSDRGS